MSDSADDLRRNEALQHLKAKRSFVAGMAAYVIVNVFLWALWLFTKGDGGGGTPPWPIWVTLGWGIGMAFSGWSVYGEKPITDADIDEEMRRGG